MNRALHGDKPFVFLVSSRRRRFGKASARVAMTKINRKVLSITPGLVPHSLLYKLIRTKIRHSRMLLAGIQAGSDLDPRLKHSGVSLLG
jgi:hypothetical protein